MFDEFNSAILLSVGVSSSSKAFAICTDLHTVLCPFDHASFWHSLLQYFSPLQALQESDPGLVHDGAPHVVGTNAASCIFWNILERTSLGIDRNTLDLCVIFDPANLSPS